MKKLYTYLLLLLVSTSAFAQTEVFMANGRVRVCKGILKDSEKGKTKGDYDHNENYTLTISIPGAKSITLKFKSFCTEKDNDILRIFDGKDTFAALIGTYSGTKNPGTITSKDSFITLHFRSDKSVACYGWEADIVTNIIPPKVPKLTLVSSVKCKDVSFTFDTDRPVPCDSFKVGNASLSGPVAPSITAIAATNCSAGKATRFQVTLGGVLNLNGSYTFNATIYEKDFCDSFYPLNCKVTFSIADCPLTVVLKADSDTICKNSCTWLRATVAGGSPSKYVYTWTPSGLSGAGPHKVCPTTNTRYILRVTDGSSIPSSDTVDIAVLSPPQAMADTEVCYYSSNFYVRATPPGGKWYGKGIVNSTTGEYKPNGNYGNNKIWYQVGNCADTMLVNVTTPWNLENQFCPGTAPRAVWWYGPAGGTWSGPNITPAGIFDPKTAGTYQDTYTWKGCISVKKILVQGINAKPFDTTCESRTLDTLQFTPYGVYMTWFPGLINSYYGWFNPSAMGGPGNKMIVFNGGGCTDTTMLTVLASEAGPNDTFCPHAGKKVLTGFRPGTGYTWTGRGITDPNLPDYDPAFFFGLGKPTWRDTLTIRAGVCSDKKYVYLIPTKIAKPDTQFFCLESAARSVNIPAAGVGPAGGKWTGKGVSAGGIFTPAVAGYGAHTLTYTKNGCTDSLVAFVRPKPVIQSDTTVCIASSPFNLYAQMTGGAFYGTGITNNALGSFSPTVAGKGLKNITYVSKQGCIATCKLTVDTMPVVYFTNTVSDFCFKDSGFALTAMPAGGSFYGAGVAGTQFNPNKAGSGNHKLAYTVKSGTCTGSANFDVIVNDTLKIAVTPGRDTICPGEVVWLRSKGSGGDASSYFYNWSHGQTGNGTFVSPASTQQYTVTLTDGCSDPAIATVDIFKHPKPYFSSSSSAPKCFGQTGFAKVQMKDADPYLFQWDVSPPYTGDSLTAAVGNSYRVTATNLRTGCTNDTSVEIPGYKAIQAGFILNIPNGEKCLSNIFPQLRLFNTGQGGETGTWYWGDGSTEPFDPNTNPKHTYNGDLNTYTLKLVIFNAGGCKDSATAMVCFRDTVVMYIPTAFTPDGDNRNDVFAPSLNGVRDYRFIVYNRWGQVIFEATDVSQSWDGTHNGKPCPEGIYSWYMTYKGRKIPMQQTKGSLLLMRNKE
ncbi:MAG: gliding motility-associated C-terminal domain-containing protein [Bacteroidetes bacterium]|nr:gliding motility-associated C-terminal domain-containing protein [Bacteroidota bacterium]